MSPRARILPGKLSTPALREAVAATLESFGLEAKAPKSSQLLVRIEGPVPEGASLREAHDVWTDEGLRKTGTPAGFPKQDLSANCPEGLCRVSVECWDGPSGGMSSFHGFKGYFLSLLLKTGASEVWDARGEEAE